MKLSFNLFRKLRPSSPEVASPPDPNDASPTPQPSASRLELRRSHPPSGAQRREAAYPPPQPPEPLPAPARAAPPTPPTVSSPESTPGTSKRSARPTSSRRPAQSTRGFGRRTTPPAEPTPPPTRDAKQRKSEAELRRQIGPTMQYDDPT